MATLITKNSSTAAAVPGTGDLVQGELAVNVTDKKVYTKDSGGAVVKLVGSLGNQEANAPAFTGPISANGSTGTTGQVLTSQGSGSPAQWSSSVSGLQLLATLVPTAGVLNVSATNLPAVESLLVIVEGITLSAADGIYFGISDNNGSSYSGNVLFTGTSSGTPTGQVQLYRTKTSGPRKPYTILRAGTVEFSSSGTTGVINAIRISTAGVGTQFSAGGSIYIYGLG